MALGFYGWIPASAKELIACIYDMIIRDFQNEKQNFSIHFFLPGIFHWQHFSEWLFLLTQTELSSINS